MVTALMYGTREKTRVVNWIARSMGGEWVKVKDQMYIRRPPTP
jgi:hypothetical protein